MSTGNRQRLLEAGIELLSEKTFSQISMDQVADLSGVSKPMIYYYFNNKEGYYKALAEHLLKMARAMTTDLFQPELSLRRNLVKYVRFRIDYVRNNKGLSRAFMSIVTDPNIGLLIEELQEEFNIMRMEYIDPMFDNAVRNGEIHPDTNRIMTFMMLNSIIVSYSMKILNEIPLHDEIAPEEIVGMLFDGISVRGKDM